jgi:PIN domain nuclease of toxin-antitoxin system
VLIWAVNDPKRLSKATEKAIESASGQGGLAVSGITLWEISRLVANGALIINPPTEDFLDKMSSQTAVLPHYAQNRCSRLRAPSQDPFDPADRLIGATAWAAAIPLVTKDRAIRESARFPTIW